MALAPGTRIGPYEVVTLLGTGGMGEVYRATDPRLERDVAIKVLPEAVRASSESGVRFEREARLLASLNHPNIATIHGLEDLGGSRAIVMELVDGPSLADLIARGPLGLAESARIADQIADGMSSAHARGIVHRDLKPSNVRIALDGRVKILDFGLARMVIADANAIPNQQALEDARTVAVATREGTVVGTPAYMSPEQAVGGPVGAGTDVWAFGAVLFEMLSGRRAFPGATIMEILTSVLRGTVDWQALPADVPSQLRLLMERCLEHEASGRLSDFGDARNVLRPFASPAFVTAVNTAADTKSIVVLPFANLSPDPDTEYFSDGLTDEIITDLSRIRSLRVISRSSAMRLKGDARGLAAIGRDLACPYVLEGSVRRAANALRITARLVDAPNDVQLWADKYGGTLDDVFDMQERVSRSIVDALEIRLTPQEAEQLAERPIADVRAQECYLRAQSEIWSSFPALWIGQSATWKPRSGLSATTPWSTKDSVWLTSSTSTLGSRAAGRRSTSRRPSGARTRSSRSSPNRRAAIWSARMRNWRGATFMAAVGACGACCGPFPRRSWRFSCTPTCSAGWAGSRTPRRLWRDGSSTSIRSTR